ncbi:MAG: helicase-associated domain-containing protein, partial [Anaerolineales bacterium]|nr:helicase-associated domain-containing protein [Anaerolineales bacterium]
MRALGWQDDALQVDGLTLPDVSKALTGALQHSGLLIRDDHGLRLNVSVQKFAARPYAEQVRPLWRGFVLARPWVEYQDPHKYYFNMQHHPAGRLALSVALAALPPDAEGFFDVNALSAALFERVGEFFALDYPPQSPYYFQETPDEIARKEKERVEKLRADWNAEERVWMAHALTTWLYFLGIVEIEAHNKIATRVRLTELGRALFHPETIASPRAAASSTAAWVVQPNFEIVVYLDTAMPPQLALLEQYAERLKTQEHTAHYRLTRETVYHGLERGGALDALVAALQKGSSVPLPANVLTELREWNARREKITLVRRAHLLEFENEDARAEAFADGLVGTRIGERFVWV